MGSGNTPDNHGQRFPPLLRNVSFMLMWASVAASGFGDRLIQLAAWTLLGIDFRDASSVQASVYFFFFLPYLVFSPLGGWLADTLPRKWIMFACDEIRALLMLAAFVLVPAGTARAIPPDHVIFELAGLPFTGWHAVYAIVFAVGTMAAIFNPTRNATVPQIVRTNDLQSANAIILGLAVIASLIGMLVGGWLIDVMDSLRVGLFVAVGSFAVSGTFFIFLRIRKRRASIHAHRGQLQRMVQGAIYIARHRSVLQLVGLGVTFWAASHVLIAAIAALNAHYYDLPGPLLAPLVDADDDNGGLILHMAMMNAVLGAGMLTTAVVVSLFSTRRESPLVIMLCLLLTGLFVFLLGINRSYEWGLVFAFMVGFFGNAMIVYVNAQTQSICPDYIRGRVFGVREIFGTIAAVGVNLLIWQLPETDVYMVPVLYALAAAFVLIAVVALSMVLARGPMENRAANACWHLARGFALIWHRLRAYGRANVPAQGPVVLAANHTTALDPFIMQAGCQRHIRWVMLQAFRFRALEPLWRAIDPIFLDKHSGQIARIRQVVQRLEEGHIVGMFPEGRLQRRQRTLGPFQPGTARIAQRAGAWIVPVWIAGTPRRQWMLLHLLQPSRARVVFGKPFKPDPDASTEQINQQLRDRMLELAQWLEQHEREQR